MYKIYIIFIYQRKRKRDAFYLRKIDFKPIKDFIVKITYGGLTHGALYKFLKVKIKILLHECLAQTNFKNYKKSSERKVAGREEGRRRTK